MAEPLPVGILTGFLGSGKTTLLGRLLRDPALSDTAVIINEFGEIGLDHELIATADENLVQLTTGCLCCAVRGDFTRTLLDLAVRRSTGNLPPFARVILETSGLADPAPILQAFMADWAVAERFVLAQVTALVDAVHGAASLDAHPEARRQVAMADRILFSKTDAADPTPLRARVAVLNPSALLGNTTDPDIALTLAAHGGTRPWMRWDAFPGARHTEGIGTALILRERPLPGAALALLLEALTTHAGPRLLRAKGLVDVAEMPGRPALIHGVQHVFAAPEWLPAWPTDDHRSRIVVIGRDIPPHWPARLLDAIVDDVKSLTA